jgi:hypothetical protein
MTEDILLRVEAGKITREDATGLRRSKPKGNAEMVSVIRERFLEVARAGKSHAQDELKRQKASLSSLAAGDPPTDEPPNVLPPGSKLPANLPMAKEIIDLIERAGGEEKVLEFMTAELAGEARVTAQITVDEIWARLLGEARRSYNDAVRSGLDEPAALRSVEAALHGLSPAPSDLAGRQVAEVAYNQGRDVAAKVSAVDGEAAWVIRSEVLDQATCEACSQLDGVEVRIGTAEYEQLMPPAQCYGGDNCRGFYVILSDGVNDAAN